MTTNRHTNNPGYKPQDIIEWSRNILGVWGYLKRLSVSKDQGNAEWTRKQYEAYWERFKVLMDNPPKMPSRWVWNQIKGMIANGSIRQSKPKPGRKVSRGIRTRTS